LIRLGQNVQAERAERAGSLVDKYGIHRQPAAAHCTKLLGFEMKNWAQDCFFSNVVASGVAKQLISRHP
ncbi:hypothetical protein TUN205_11693, partial [Pyrenophora tritici-repentis]